MEVSLAHPDEVKPLRDLHRQEMQCQIVLDSWLGRGWTHPYLLKIDGRKVGYGLVGSVGDAPRDCIVEFYLLPIYRAASLPLFRQLVEVSQAKSIEAQSNDRLLTLMLYDCARTIESPVILFDDAVTTHLNVPDAIFRKVTAEDTEHLGKQKLDSDAEWLIEADGQPVASGGVLFHYNVPYGDIYMAVAELFRRRGYGSFLVQELKRTCYEMGRIPSARCNAVNLASRATLQKAGMHPCARVLFGTLTTKDNNAT